ncbi:hypothetical protein ACTA71_007321 [Dictyostelium dimigraforme]
MLVNELKSLLDFPNTTDKVIETDTLGHGTSGHECLAIIESLNNYPSYTISISFEANSIIEIIDLDESIISTTITPIAITPITTTPITTTSTVTPTTTTPITIAQKDDF